MGSFSIWHWLIVLLVVLLLFGSGKISTLMGDLATGIKSFKKNMKEEDDASLAESAPPAAQPPAGSIQGPAAGQQAQSHASTSRPAA
ncbi:twin-arginine translocase TatA/TatE family subunit [Siccirubricoccus sp. KC 17139]|uniref:Sec-independent protein translocase protein TatA n=1 Tax=Siccirubricoccus soli TaxID=2899147 RepID=A0ABT1D774_9PROT|nr:twin-arginine translocase TatA/TatE family subunit [Siccirubricoccus soli]MCO6417768.1 twin-arginine translocase TatA/TatE family subunit [Siccirubricoccus soli]MCP2683903.1 twin-arginine translocase TatA/TatE family subunit [Siccirubricoccus soli]